MNSSVDAYRKALAKIALPPIAFDDNEEEENGNDQHGIWEIMRIELPDQTTFTGCVASATHKVRPLHDYAGKNSGLPLWHAIHAAVALTGVLVGQGM